MFKLKNVALIIFDLFLILHPIPFVLSLSACYPIIPIYHLPIKGQLFGDALSNHTNLNFDNDRFGNRESSLYLNRNESYTHLPSDVYFDTTFTMTVWIFPRPTNKNSTRILEFSNGLLEEKIFLGKSYDKLNHLTFVMHKDDLKNDIIHLESSIPLMENLWTFLVLTFDGSTALMYFNGSVVAMQEKTQTSPILGINNFMKGDSYSMIDDLRFYKSRLTLKNIQLLQDKNEDEFICDDQIETCSLTNHWPINITMFSGFKGILKDTIGDVDMIFKSNVSFTRDRFDNSYSALNLRGSYGYLRSGVYFFSTFTISLWIKPALSLYSYIIDFGNGPQSDNIILAQSYTKLGYPTLLIYKGKKEMFNLMSNVRLINDVWSFLAVKFDGTTATIYINGNKTGVQTRNFDLSLDPYLLRKNNYIGRSNNNFYLTQNSIIDDLRFFSKSLSDDDIVKLMDKKDNYEDEPNCVFMFSRGLRESSHWIFIFLTLFLRIFYL